MNAELEKRLEGWLAALDIRHILGTLAAVVFLAAWNRGIALLYGIFALIVGMVAVAWLMPRWNLRGVDARRLAPDRANEGDRIGIDVELRVAGRRPRFMLEVVDSIPFAEEEKQRPTAFFPRTRQTASLRHTLACSLRGVHTLGPLELRTSYPLGIASAHRILAGTEMSLVVYPSTFPIADLPLLGASRWPIGGVKAVSQAGGGGEFFAVREYRNGDSARRIHWPASAKRGELIVREYEYQHATEVMLALDLNRSAHVGHGRESTLEYMVKIAASIARFALDTGHSVGLYAEGAKPIALAAGHGPQHFQEILEILASVAADGHGFYRDVQEEALARMSLGGVLVLFQIPGFDDPACATETAFRRHARVLPVVFDATSFEPTARRAEPPPGGYCVRKGDDLAKVFSQ